MNGPVSADMTPNPGLYALKYHQQYMKVEPVDFAMGVFSITNRFDFISSDQTLSGRWEMVEDGNIIHTRPLRNLDIKPQAKKNVTLSFSDIKFKKGSE